MYSPEIRNQLEDKNIETGDKVKVNGRTGKLMPKPETGDPETITLKLENGYNIGLKPQNIELLEKKTEKKSEREGLSHDEDKPDILVLHTGGTIASRVSYEEGGVKPAFDPEDLAEMYPGLADQVNIHSKVVAQMLSENMEPGHWKEVAEAVHENKEAYDGIIIGHGTDTLSYTGAALSLMLKGLETGVLLVGAQRSSDRPSSDARQNLLAAARFLTETGFTGVGVAMHANTSDNKINILPGHKVRKNHTSRRDAFEPVNTSRIGLIDLENDRTVLERSFDSGDYEFRPQASDNVGWIKVRPGMTPEEFRFYRKNYSALLVEGTGLGHAPVEAFDGKTEHHEEIMEELEKAAGEMPVVMASQCINGRINMDVYEAGVKISDAEVISAGDMHPGLAYVKLSWALANADSGNVEEVFRENIAGEFEERSMIDE